ncbi:hypothetical protein MBLNU230_g3306t1 [Neophaeotheca triangularis]
MQSAARTFFASKHFAVAGASSQTHKFGHKIFAWYLAYDLPVTPLNPSCSAVTVRRKDYETAPSVSALQAPKDTALSVITPPRITAQLLREAKEAGIRAVWLQPGSFSDVEMQYALEAFPGAAVAGMEGGTRGGEGWCVLVDGEKAMRDAGKDEKL